MSKRRTMKRGPRPARRWKRYKALAWSLSWLREVEFSTAASVNSASVAVA
jgi:hypothetical protein